METTSPLISAALIDDLNAPAAKPKRSRFAPPPAQPKNTARAAVWDLSRRVTPRDRSNGAQLHISPVASAVMRARGIENVNQMQRFLDIEEARNDPFDLPDIEAAIERLHRAIESREPILIFGDYDVDGVTSTAMMQRSLALLGANVEAIVPEREDGYGLSVRAVEAAHARGFGLILTVDNGVTAFAALERAQKLGIEVIVTDHHEPAETLPPALAIVNPKRSDSQYPFRELCGCAVAYKVMLAYLERYQPRHAAGFAERYSDFVALATIADCMPLYGENRLLAHEGLRQLAATKKAGLRALMESAGVRIENATLNGTQVGFFMAPRLNAAGRFNRATLSLQLLLAKDAASGQELAAQLEAHNRRRQEITTDMHRQAADLMFQSSDLDRDCAVVVAGENWPLGMVGLLASRLVEKHGRPAIVLGVDGEMARGSGRSIDGFDLGHILKATRDIIQGGGGHAGACGVHLSTDRVEEFRARVLECTGSHLTQDDFLGRVEPDCVVESDDLTPLLASDLAMLEPCGKGNPEALLAVTNARIQDGRNIGKTGTHLKWQVQIGARVFDALWWSPGDRANGFGIGKPIDLCFSPQLNHFNGQTKLQLIIKAARPAV